MPISKCPKKKSECSPNHPFLPYHLCCPFLRTRLGSSSFSAFSGISRKFQVEIEHYAHPYTSCDKGAVERHNGLIRRFIAKKKRIDSFTAELISDVETWCNSLPRKILDYRTPDEIFEKELDKIYHVDAI